MCSKFLAFPRKGQAINSRLWLASVYVDISRVTILKNNSRMYYFQVNRRRNKELGKNNPKCKKGRGKEIQKRQQTESTI